MFDRTCDGSGRTARNLLIIVNPQAGRRRGREWRATLDALTGLGTSVTVRETSGPTDTESLACAAVGGPFDALVAAGGDGTINGVINGVIQGLATQAAGSPPLPLGIIPLGTANVLAHELGLPTADPAGTARVLAHGAAVPIHLGSANGRNFALMAGVGLDAHVVERVDPWLKRRIGKCAYVIETISQIATYRPSFRYRVEIGAEAWGVAAVVIARSRFYGGRFVCAPAARLTEPHLHVCLFPRAGRWNALRYGTALVRGQLDRCPDFRIVTASAVTVTGPEGDPVQGDGDIIARLPLRAAVSPGRLPVLCP